MNSLYAFIGNLNNLWVVSFAVILIVLDIFLLGTTHLLMLGLASVVFVLLTFGTDNPVILTWSIPLIVLTLFVGQRKLLNLTSPQKLPHETKLEGSFDARIEAASDTASSDYFFGYKDEKQAVSYEAEHGSPIWKAVLQDGRHFIIAEDDRLKAGMNVKVEISNNATARVVKIYE
ncbi:hypothetical protein N9O21_06475 [Rhodobacteraceae bacterium]|nr:hypothetical protein [Paracoccaceae bacterium]